MQWAAAGLVCVSLCVCVCVCVCVSLCVCVCVCVVAQVSSASITVAAPDKPISSLSLLVASHSSNKQLHQPAAVHGGGRRTHRLALTRRIASRSDGLSQLHTLIPCDL